MRTGRLDTGGADVALVVLGAAVWSGGVASPTLRRRTIHAARLYKEGAARLVVLSGGLGKHAPEEAHVMADICIEEGVSRDVLVLEAQSTSTFENVAFSAIELEKRGIEQVIVVTDAYHIPRARMCFRHLGYRVAGSAPDHNIATTRFYRRLYHWLRELAALPWYRLTMANRLQAALEKGRASVS
ncbi:MAG: YdcF family protein [Ahrensia sp.]|nr:YdcF family protein [Ahrensia sp.]